MSKESKMSIKEILNENKRRKKEARLRRIEERNRKRKEERERKIKERDSKRQPINIENIIDIDTKINTYNINLFHYTSKSNLIKIIDSENIKSAKSLNIKGTLGEDEAIVFFTPVTRNHLSNYLKSVGSESIYLEFDYKMLEEYSGFFINSTNAYEHANGDKNVNCKYSYSYISSDYFKKRDIKEFNVGECYLYNYNDMLNIIKDIDFTEDEYSPEVGIYQENGNISIKYLKRIYIPSKFINDELVNWLNTKGYLFNSKINKNICIYQLENPYETKTGKISESKSSEISKARGLKKKKKAKSKKKVKSKKKLKRKKKVKSKKKTKSKKKAKSKKRKKYKQQKNKGKNKNRKNN